MAHPQSRRATYADLLRIPHTQVAEILDGTLYVSPRPATPHALATSAIGEELGPPFKRGRGGPGGWMILDEPELHLGREPDIIVPDIGGWRRERLPEVPHAPFITVPPDWVTEALSPSTATIDRTIKMAIYAREGVGHVWLVDALAQALEVFTLDGATYRLSLTARGGARVRVPPFDAIELDLSLLWAR